MTDNAAGYHDPGYAQHRDMATAYAADSFFYSLIADRGPTAISALLAAFGTEDTWSDVVQTGYGVSVEELRAEWNAYLQTLRTTPESAADEDSRFAR